ncbi:tRNA1(Val) (adenine(37)-N6)-methyltransferase [Phenylobacterium sp.]|uniref:tRNA1(Val) (adenine(37)-N6)-methyltransferase n=1 Tax=Phenylobacterium sp. TaxID=1871053 RepID=UPI0027313FDE|nr:methyltransferase domain-containing protein [Phenylobacterium sp.]MDP1872961.1 methyltransferase domain-containing protein [Phenylobacterium sp.]MDP3489833.1 methyltransferase domain-containing protein [Phenylobacterium sp.]
MSEPSHAPVEPPTENRLLGGRVVLRQPARGYRAGLDAALLAAACDSGPGDRVIEAGCGAGGALLVAATRRPGALFTGVERDSEALALALANVGLNGLAARVTVQSGDVEAGFRALGLQPFDAALANPPFFDDPAALRAPAPEKTGAWMADGGLAAWAGFLLKAIREGGSLTVIHRADRLADLLSSLGTGAGSFQVRGIHPFADAPAKRILVRAIKTGKAPLRLLPPLVLHPRQGAEKHTPEAEAILRGEADLPWL